MYVNTADQNSADFNARKSCQSGLVHEHTQHPLGRGQAFNMQCVYMLPSAHILLSPELNSDCTSIEYMVHASNVRAMDCNQNKAHMPLW